LKKKLLVGLLSLTACFSLGSTSFANSSTAVNENPAMNVFNKAVPAKDNYYTEITIKVGESINLTGSGFFISSAPPYDAIYLNRQGLVIGLKPGSVAVVADLPGGDTIMYYITVK